MRGIFHQFLRRAHGLVIGRSWIVFCRSGGCDNTVSHAVIRRIVSHLLLDPGTQSRDPFTSEELAIHLQHIRPFIGPMINEIRIPNELIDHFIALRLHRACISDKGADFFRLRWQPSEVEMDAAQEIFITADATWLDLHALPFAGHEFVDLAPFFRLFPGEARAISHDRDRSRGISTFKAG